LLEVLAVQVNDTLWARVPVPERETTVGELEALLVTETGPVADPLVVGLKVTLNMLLWPAARFSGNESPLMLNPAPLTVAWLIVRPPVPVLFSDTGCVLLLPTSTFPKAMLEGLTVR
jgi:hypothetical protein